MGTLKHYVPGILLFCLLGLLYGCAGTSSAVIPDQIGPPSSDAARIIVTREKQMAGMTTPVYIIDAGEELDANATLKIRVGEWRKATTTHMYFMNVNVLGKQVASGLVVGPAQGITFAETGQTIDDLISKNVDAVVYVDYLRSDPNKVNPVYCGNGKKECDEPFRRQLADSDGMIIGDSNAQQTAAESENVASMHDSQTARDMYGTLPLGQNSKERFREVQVIGKIRGGDTLVWDRKPGIMRVGSLWGSSSKLDQTLEFTPANMQVQAGKTYHLHYTINLGERWRIMKVE